MQASMLNLTRKWRAQTFDTLVGQELVVKILKNSLYIGHYFPVYLFSGQRGCGKTSTARIFAAALNCAILPAFQAKPKEIAVPCGTCDSCVAMMQFRHPDFIEIDAASHTGVDNMRSIIDTAYYLPILGRKKIYLIDEAHMLSKAAFNALLKVFEEPPMHAHFILATTDPEKIIETVRSRCFSLFFGAIESTLLAEHLKHLCRQEKIDYTDEALVSIARTADGSARDAINILETVRFSYPSVTQDAVLRVLGHVDDHKLAQLLVPVFKGDGATFLALWSDPIIQRVSPQYLWTGLVRLIRGIIWYRHGVMPTDVQSSLIQYYFSDVKDDRCTQVLEALYTVEPLFIRSSSQRTLLEFALLQLCNQFKKKSDNFSQGQSGIAVVSELDTQYGDEAESDDVEQENDDEESDGVAPVVVVHTSSDNKNVSDENLLHLCKETFTLLADPLLASVLSQIVSVTKCVESNQLVIHFLAQHSFFTDMLNTAAPLWQPLMATVYTHTGAIVFVFDAVAAAKPMVEKKLLAVLPTKSVPQPAALQEQNVPAQSSFRSEKKTYPRAAGYARSVKIVQEKAIDVSDIQRWPLTNRVLSYFPGTVTVVDEARL